MECDLQVKERAQNPPLGRATPHWSSTFTGPLGLGNLGLGGSLLLAAVLGVEVEVPFAVLAAVAALASPAFFAFFFFGSFSVLSSSSPLRFLDFLEPSVIFVAGGADFFGGFLVA